MRDEQAEKVELVLPEADDQDDREADRRKQAGHGELAGDGERVDARNDTEGHHAQQVGEQDEHEQGKHPRRVFLAVGTDAGGDDIVDEADHTLDHDLPATRNQLSLHSAHHEHIEKTQDDEHPERAVRKADLLTEQSEAIKDGLHFELVHWINLACFRH